MSNETNVKSVDELINSLLTEKGRQLMAANAATKGMPLSPKNIRRIVDYFEAEAADHLRMESYEEVKRVTDYEAKVTLHSAELGLAEKSGDAKKTEDALYILINLHEGVGEHKKAAELCKKAKDIPRAIKDLREAGEFRKAGELAEVNTRYNDALESYEAGGKLGSAAELAEKMGRRDLVNTYCALVDLFWVDVARRPRLYHNGKDPRDE